MQVARHAVEQVDELGAGVAGSPGVSASASAWGSSCSHSGPARRQRDVPGNARRRHDRAQRAGGVLAGVVVVADDLLQQAVDADGGVVDGREAVAGERVERVRQALAACGRVVVDEHLEQRLGDRVGREVGGHVEHRPASGASFAAAAIDGFHVDATVCA